MVLIRILEIFAFKTRTEKQKSGENMVMHLRCIEKKKTTTEWRRKKNISSNRIHTKRLVYPAPYQLKWQCGIRFKLKCIVKMGLIIANRSVCYVYLCYVKLLCNWLNLYLPRCNVFPFDGILSHKWYIFRKTTRHVIWML